jgi:hypothetical protein
LKAGSKARQFAAVIDDLSKKAATAVRRGHTPDAGAARPQNLAVAG